jgi:protein phosphatase
MSVRQSFGFPLSVHVGSDVGRIRDNNEDSFGSAWLDDGSLFVIVADGMGGHEAGEVASSLAVRVVEDVIREDPDADPRDRLYNALLEANQAILDEGASSGTRGMGTTAIVAILKGNQAYIGQVGDSRAYQIRKGHKIWRSTDHTRVQMLVDDGKLTDEQARHHPEAGMLTRALGHARMADGQPLVPEVLDEPLILEPGDTLLLCSDGLHDLVEDDEIGRSIAGEDGDPAIAKLIELACERGGHDNITISVINAGERVADYDASFRPPEPSPRAYVADSTSDEEYSTFDLGGQAGGGHSGGGHSGGGHLHAPTIAPGEAPPPRAPPVAVTMAPQPFPSASKAPTARGGQGSASKAEPAKSNKMPLIIGGVVAALLLLLGVIGCGAGIGAWFLLG